MKYRSWAWARAIQAQGWQLEWSEPGSNDWMRVDENLADDAPEAENEPYLYRLHQSSYEVPCPFRRGTLSWATAQQKGGNAVDMTGKEWEIVPA